MSIMYVVYTTVVLIYNRRRLSIDACAIMRGNTINVPSDDISYLYITKPTNNIPKYIDLPYSKQRFEEFYTKHGEYTVSSKEKQRRIWIILSVD